MPVNQGALSNTCTVSGNQGNTNSNHETLLFVAIDKLYDPFSNLSIFYLYHTILNTTGL